MTTEQTKQQIIAALGPNWWHVSVCTGNTSQGFNNAFSVQDAGGPWASISWTLRNSSRREVVGKTLDEAYANAMELIGAEGALETARRAISVNAAMTREVATFAHNVFMDGCAKMVTDTMAHS
jgi:hypothetical protein